MALRVHLKDKQQVVFDINTENKALEQQRETELNAFFQYNRENIGQQSLYVDMPKNHVYDKSKKVWKKRK